MCGLVGVVNAKKSIVDESKKIRGLLSCIRYRGPDAHKFFADEDAGVILGHCLLAVSSYENLVIQPFLTRSGNVILFNGEIYNFMKLRDCLTEKLSLPDDVSDTVILSMYIEQYGIHEFLKKAVGMYCIVFWDKINSLMYFARDKFGQKPLFFTEESDKLYFCSELNPLINTLQKPQINKETVEQLLTLGFSVDTPFKNVFCSCGYSTFPFRISYACYISNLFKDKIIATTFIYFDIIIIIPRASFTIRKTYKSILRNRKLVKIRAVSCIYC